MWQRMSDAGPNSTFKHGRGIGRTIDWTTLCVNVAALPAEELWRHDQAGDLPHNAGAIDGDMVDELVTANATSHARGFTYTHHDMTIGDNAAIVARANMAGFSINLSANNLTHADTLAAVAAGGVVTLQSIEYQRRSKGKEWTETLPEYRARVALLPQSTPEGRPVVVCPATYRDDVTCKSCGLCARADRKVIVGFPAHGAGKGKVSRIAA